MIISGNTSRKILRENKFSANLSVSLNNCTGSSEVGFSGQGITYKFNFTSGKIFDPENRYFSSYLPNKSVNIETNFSGTAYDYSINGSRILNSGLKQNFYAEKFYINTTGAVLDASIEIKSKKPTLSLSIPASFISGSYLTGYLVTDSISGFSLFSGYFDEFSSFSFFSGSTGIISSSSPGVVIISESSLNLGTLDSQVLFDTSAGSYPIRFLVEKVGEPYISYRFEILQGSDFLNNVSIPSSVSNASKVGGLILDYSYQTNSSLLIPTSLPLDISLSYYSGSTGYYGLVTGVQVNSGGNGYLNIPMVTFSGGGGNSASGNSILGSTSLNYNAVLNVEITSFGSGYTSAPVVAFFGGTGIINNVLPTIASGSGLTTFYTKSFTGSFDLSTGSWPNLESYSTASFLSGNKYTKTGSLITENSLINIQVNYNTSFDDDFMVAKLVISGINDNIIERYITGTK